MKQITLFIMSSLMFQLSVFAQQEGSCGTGVTWELNNNTLTISGDGEMTDFSSPGEENATLPSWNLYKAQIKHIVVKGNVTHIGDYAFCQYENLVSADLGEGVVEIGNNTFNGCISLSELSLPNTLERIGDKWSTYSGNSFRNCSSLTELTLPVNVNFVSVSTFSGCNNMEKVYWNAIDCTFNPMNPERVFDSCPIQEVVFGDNVKTIPESAFRNRKTLSKVSTQGTIERVGKDAFYGTEWLGLQGYGKMIYIDHAAYLYADEVQVTEPITLTLEEGTTSITADALRDNKKLVKVVLPSTLKEIGDYAFDGCSSLNEVEYNSIEVEDKSRAVFPSSVLKFMFGSEVKKVPANLLKGCYGLSEIKLPESLETIGDDAFQECNEVKELIIPDKVEKIGRTAIYKMDNLERLTIGEGLKELDYYYVFGLCPKLTNIIWNAIALNEKEFDAYHASYRCQAPVTTLVFGDKVEYVPGQLFWERSTLKDVTFGKSVKKIGEAAFRACSGLTRIDLPNSLETVCDYAFYDTGLEKLFIPENVKSLGTWGFVTATLKQVISTPSVVPENLSSFSSHSDDIVLYVPDTKTYGNGWRSQYRKLMQPMVKADTEEYYYDGTTPVVSFSCNIPEYELVSISDAEMDGTVGEHSIPLTATFKGEKEFTVQLTHNYIVNKGLQEIAWQQTFDDLHVGDEVVLDATASSGLDVTYRSSDSNIELKHEEGKTVMICKNKGEVKLRAYQYGDDNWQAATSVEKKFTIAERSTDISGVQAEQDNLFVTDCYDVNGCRINALRKGINIVRYSDGTIRKVIMK